MILNEGTKFNSGFAVIKNILINYNIHCCMNKALYLKPIYIVYFKKLSTQNNKGH